MEGLHHGLSISIHMCVDIDIHYTGNTHYNYIGKKVTDSLAGSVEIEMASSSGSVDLG